MKNTNHCVLHGRLGKDPEVRFRQSGGASVLFSLCTNDDYHNGTEWVEVKEWHDCVVVGTAAEQYAEKYQQGDEVIVQGRIKPRFYEKNGQKVKVVEIYVSTMELIAKRVKPTGNDQQRGGASAGRKTDQRKQYQAGSGRQEETPVGGMSDDDYGGKNF
ncbi:single-stranded DNA-binding protein [Ralstonia insidiosa]|jgi:single-strand DNA-binding protein|nr:single-stranded DNA-binding protein [Ralstonia insidiosa]MBA9940862.1 single-stranded DNA-binding protein [Ralstonia insidiosa]MBC9969084.1 single-stranded DNA-binding protein [Ralstonia insidiosa]MBX3905311.1 single-stranded DNA-binding protein [Ralstonia insidiosa]